MPCDLLWQPTVVSLAAPTYIGCLHHLHWRRCMQSFQRGAPEPPPTVGEIHTTELILVAQVSDVEGRFSDFLNSTYPSLDIVPKSVIPRSTTEAVNLQVL